MTLKRHNLVVELKLDKYICEKLIVHNLVIIDNLCEAKKSDLIKLGFKMSDIEQIEIKLQLQGLDLKR